MFLDIVNHWVSNHQVHGNMQLPFNEKLIGGNKLRTFSEDVNSNELKWHFDEEDRLVEIIKSNGWRFQMDNELPLVLVENQKYFIPKGTYHRIIKGVGDLIVNVTVS